MFAKYATAIPAGAAITLTLLFAMHSLIAMGSIEVDDDRTRAQLTFLPQQFDEEVREFEFDKPDKPQPQELPDLPDTTEPLPNGLQIPVAKTAPRPPGPGRGLSDPFTNDGPLMTIVRVQPTYPPPAASRGLEGFVVVEFEVLADGTVGHVSVVQSSSRVFERAAIQAAKRFRFKARVVDGVPLATSGVRYRFRFEMND